MTGLLHFLKFCSNGAEIDAPVAPMKQDKTKSALLELLHVLHRGSTKIGFQNTRSTLHQWSNEKFCKSSQLAQDGAKQRPITLKLLSAPMLLYIIKIYNINIDLYKGAFIYTPHYPQYAKSSRATGAAIFAGGAR